ncbi:hypothetical protein L1987_47822 [Smallanthus sonchifolius]|uniref:Uncharacterized protein n=1 Tax=Smallanthus sonchifolius TaxID=185202 RepID=A0ACB9FQ37_9ASTR|nr:hypothetical protein L1987_47822 [Smallanthus sonchifolius]
MAEKKLASHTPARDEDSSSDFEETYSEKSVPTQVSQILESEELKKLEESEEVNDVDSIKELYDFPPDPENWKEEDLREIWADAPPFMMKPGWDPNWVDKDELEIINEEIREDGSTSCTHEIPFFHLRFIILSTIFSLRSFPTRFATAAVSSASISATATTSVATASTSVTSTATSATATSAEISASTITTTTKKSTQTTETPSSSAAAVAGKSELWKETWIYICGFRCDLTDLCGDFFGHQETAFNQNPQMR